MGSNMAEDTSFRRGDCHYDNCTVALVEISEYMRVGRMMEPETLCDLLHNIVTSFERGLEPFRVRGVGFFNGVFTALATSEGTHADDAARFALYCITQADSIPVNPEYVSQGTVSVCAAIHTGPVAVVSIFDRPALFGETVSAASRMLHESGAVGRLVCSGSAAMVLDLSLYNLDSRVSWTGHAGVGQAIRIIPTQMTKGLLGGTCLVCPVTGKITNYMAPFLHPGTQDIAGLFGFIQGELKHIRMLFGPDTDVPCIMHTMKHVRETVRRTEISGILLYTRNGMPRQCNLVFEFVPSMILLSLSCVCGDLLRAAQPPV